jgi:hypothetical protein
MNRKSHEEELRKAEDYMVKHPALYQHYNIRGVHDILSGKLTGHEIADISSQDIDKLQQKLSDR